jgi:hypothetical protein
MGVGTVILRRRALVGPIQSGRLNLTTPEGQARAFTPFILNLVLSESVGIFGLLLAFLSGQPVYSIVFSAGALFLLFVHRPNAPDLVAPLSGEHRVVDSNPIG